MSLDDLELQLGSAKRRELSISLFSPDPGLAPDSDFMNPPDPFSPSGRLKIRIPRVPRLCWGRESGPATGGVSSQHLRPLSSSMVRMRGRSRCPTTSFAFG